MNHEPELFTETDPTVAGYRTKRLSKEARRQTSVPYHTEIDCNNVKTCVWHEGTVSNKFLEKLPDGIKKLETKLGDVKRRKHEYIDAELEQAREDAAEHENCCDECSKRDEAIAKLEEIQDQIENDTEYLKMEAEAKELEAEILRLKAYLKEHQPA